MLSLSDSSYPITLLVGAHHPTVTPGAPLRAPKRPKITTEITRFAIAVFFIGKERNRPP